MDDETDFDVEILADKVIQLLRVQEKQVFWIWASTHSLDLVEALGYRIRSRGAFWSLKLVFESLLQQIGKSAPQEYLGIIPEHELRWLADTTAIIEIHDHGSYVPGIDLARRRAMVAEWVALIDAARKLGVRHVQVTNPTQALASAYGMDLETLRQRYWPAINLDQAALDQLQEKVGEMFSTTREVHITSPAGTDLKLRIDRRPVHLDTESLPRGEVYVAPWEDSAHGTAVIDYAFIQGKPAERLYLAFRGGRVAAVNAAYPAQAEALRKLMAVSTGDKDVIAEFAIGLNPAVGQPVGDIRLDEKIKGSTHIAIGANDFFGGRNRSNLHLDLLMLQPTVLLDGAILVDNGQVVDL
jgi:aminopeptidase